MVDLLKEKIKTLLRIPGEPAAPFGAPGSVRVFRAGRGFFRYRMLGWSLRQLGALIGILFVLQFFSFDPSGVAGEIRKQMDENAPLRELEIVLTVGDVWFVVEMLAIAGFVVQLPFTFLMVFLDYEYRWYIITDRSLRIREGLLRVDERTMTFSNIQNVSIRQGPLQRLLGISDLEVSTAGGGSGSSGKDDHSGLAAALQAAGSADLHQAFFRGIANPSEIRDAILARLRTERASGLGDPDEPYEPHEPRPWSSPGAVDTGALEAARGLLDEARALRQAMS